MRSFSRHERSPPAPMGDIPGLRPSTCHIAFVGNAIYLESPADQLVSNSIGHLSRSTCPRQPLSYLASHGLSRSPTSQRFLVGGASLAGAGRVQARAAARRSEAESLDAARAGQG